MALFKPTGTLHSVTEITKDLLFEMGVRAIVLDIDNTMAAHGSQEPFPGVPEWAKGLTDAGIKLILVSNNYEKRVAPFAKKFSTLGAR